MSVSFDREEAGMSEARVTVLVPAYRAASAVTGLVAAIGSQRGPTDAVIERWMKLVVVDDGSGDDTAERFEAELQAANLPFPVQVIRNGSNLGLSRSLNRALEAIETPYVLTCHQDCRFASEDYVARAVDLLDRNPDVAVVSGQSIADLDAGLSHVEKVYLAANLMDIFPDGAGELEPVGFAEGRCDAFRMAALREAGFYDTTLHHAGEDQVLSARLRGAGYRVCRAPGQRYFLSVSSSQDSFMKLVRHAQLFGRVHPYIIANRGTSHGAVGAKAGRNRTLRTTLRVLQLAGTASMVAVGVAAARRRSPASAAAVVVGANVLKFALFLRYMRYLKFEARDTAALAALQPALDVAYTVGLVNGLWLLVRPGDHTI
jgi:GT2 family glycosyltransferase